MLMTVMTTRLGDLVAINPRFEKPTSLLEDSLVRFVPMAAVDEVQGEIVTGEYKPYSELVRKGFSNFRENDVLFAKITPCMQNGKAAVFKGNDIGFGSTEFFVLRVGERVLPRFVYHLVRQEQFRADARENLTGTAGQQRVPRQFLENYTVNLPSLSEQQRIVDIMDHAASVQSLRKDFRTKLHEFVPALFAEIFGDLTHASSSWPTRRLEEVANIGHGITKGRRLTVDEALTEVPYLRVANVQDGH